MRVTFLGTGTSSGVPMIGCECDVCRSTDPKDKRLRSSVFIECDGLNICIDIGPDFRQQMLRESINRLDAVLLTHGHKDHTGGLDDIRAFNFKQRSAGELYLTQETETMIRAQYDYIFKNYDYPGIPKINLNRIDSSPFKIKVLEITPIPVLHYRMPVLGFRIKDFTYITDANHIGERELDLMKGSKVLVLNALRREKHISHFTLDEAIAVAESIGAQETYFTHISHQLGKHEEVSPLLPSGIGLGYDGLTIKL